MAMKVQFRVTRATSSVPSGAVVECLMQKCVKEGTMTVVTVDTGKEVQLPRSRLAFVGYVRATKVAVDAQPEGEQVA